MDMIKEISKKNIKLIGQKTFIVLFVFLICCLSGCARSQNEGAEKYKNGKCVVFYPGENETIKEYAMSLCEDGEEKVLDYRKEEAGDYFRITYDDGKYFYVNEDMSDLVLKVNSGAQMLSDMLRYEMKKDEIDEAYTSKFWLESDKDELVLDNIELKLEEDHMDLYFRDFDYTMDLSLGYLKMLTGKDLGFRELSDYEKKTYLSPNRPMVAITYDDGPYRTVDEVLYDIFRKYDAKATFYVAGYRMSQDELDNIAEGIELGMEFGSHTEKHSNLSLLDAYEAKAAVMETVDFVYEKLGYMMKTYRPPYGSRNYELEDIIGMPAILWTVDTKDWYYRDEETTYQRALYDVEDGDVVLMHALYMSSALASQRIVPELIDRGFQLVTVTELLEAKGYDISTLKVYGTN